ncbi:hypothetical protein DL93DRAFT_2088248 [Clavulina sp. PMI_390]|nr:hypothetical protein DL93DRAFT_2088248 [Clavulina sp. PMI_390]
MFKRPFTRPTPPCGDVAAPLVEPTEPVVPWSLFPRLALLQKPGRAPKRFAPRFVPHPFRPNVPASERIFFWVSPDSISRRRLLASKFSIPQLLTYDNALVASLADGTRVLYGGALIDWIQWCDRMTLPENRRLPIARDDLRMFLASKVGVEGASKSSNVLAGLRAWHIIQDVPWAGDDLILSYLRRATASTAPPSSFRPP